MLKVTIQWRKTWQCRSEKTIPRAIAMMGWEDRDVMLGAGAGFRGENWWLIHGIMREGGAVKRWVTGV